MKLTQLQYFQTVCQLGNSITRAAEALHVTQPGISSAIKDLETEFGVKLFHRTNKQLELTLEGAQCLERTTELLNRADILLDRMRDLSFNKNTLRIGIASMISSVILPNLLVSFHKAYPNIILDLYEEDSENLTVMLENKTLDAAFVLTKRISNQTFEVHKIAETEFVFCTSINNPLAKKEFVTLQMLVDEPLILRKNETTKYSYLGIFKKFESKGLRPNVLFYANQLHTILEFVTNNLASTFMFKALIRPTDGIIGIPIEKEEPAEIGIITKKNTYLSPNVQALVKFTQEFYLTS